MYYYYMLPRRRIFSNKSVKLFDFSECFIPIIYRITTLFCALSLFCFFFYDSNYDPFYVKDKSSLNSSFNQQLHRGSISAILMFTLKIKQMDLQEYYYHKNIIIIISDNNIFEDPFALC